MSTRLIIYDCDDYTQNFYRQQYNMNMQRNVSVAGLMNAPKPDSLLVKPPPHTITSVGKQEDSIQNCLHLQPRPPKRNLKKLLDYAGKVKMQNN